MEWSDGRTSYDLLATAIRENWVMFCGPLETEQEIIERENKRIDELEKAMQEGN